MNDVGQKIYDILKSELSEITAKSILTIRCKDIGKDPDSLTFGDVKNLKPGLLSGVLLYGGEQKAMAIKDKLERLH